MPDIPADPVAACLAAVCERSDAAVVIPCADAPYRCDGFDPADWPGKIPDFSPFRFLNREETHHA